MTDSGKNGLNIRTNASPKWDRTRCPEELASKCALPQITNVYHSVGLLCEIGKYLFTNFIFPGVSLSTFIEMGNFKTFGIYFITFLDEFKASATMTALINATYCVFFSVFGKNRVL